MAYEPLHHKYRPQTFQDLVGQTAIATTLSNAIVQQRIAPAYLFSGPRGTGKTSSARILAKSLNCQSGDKPTPQPCGTCEACHSITTGIALDVIEIDAASNTGVDNIRELIEKAQFAPVQCRYKVYVIDECHMLSTAAFNALLKTLEEPPERVVFVLATTDPQRVLPTIISRCQRFDYRRIPLEEMVGHLRHIANQELIDINDDALRLVAQLSQGGLRDAESLLDQLSLLPPPVAIEAVWDLVGAVPERELFTITQAIASNNAEAVIERSRQLMDRGREPLVVLQNLASFYRDLLVARTAPQRNDLVAITPSTWQEMTEFAQQLDVAVILQGQQHLRTSEVQLKNSTQPRLWLEVTLMGLLPAALVQPQGMAVAAPIAVAPSVPPANAIATPQPPAIAPTPISPPIQVPAPPAPPPAVQGAASQANPPVPAPTPPPPAAASQPPAPPQPPQAPPTEPAIEPIAPTGIDLGEMWKQVIANVEYRSTQMLLRQQSQLMRLTGSVAHISVTQQWLSSIQTRQSAIESALAKVVGSPIKVKLDPVAQKPDAPPPNGTATSGGAPAATAPPAPSPAAPKPLLPVQPAAPTPSAQPAAPTPPPAPAASQPAATVAPQTPSVASPPQSTDPTEPPSPAPAKEESAPASATPVAEPVQSSPPPPVEPAAVGAVLADIVPAPVEPTNPAFPQSSEPLPDNSGPIPVDPGPLEEEVEISIDPMAGLTPVPKLTPLAPINSAEGDPESAVDESQAQLAPIGEAGLPPTVKPLWEEDEIVRSAKQLAQFFNGEVVRDEVVVGELAPKDVVVDVAAVAAAESVPAIAPQASEAIAHSSTEPVTVPASVAENIDEDDDVPF